MVPTSLPPTPTLVILPRHVLFSWRKTKKKQESFNGSEGPQGERNLLVSLPGAREVCLELGASLGRSSDGACELVQLGPARSQLLSPVSQPHVPLLLLTRPHVRASISTGGSGGGPNPGTEPCVCVCV